MKMQSRKRFKYVTCLFLTAICVVLILTFDWSEPPNKPGCHKQLHSAVLNWRVSNDKEAFPNRGGKSEESLAELTQFLSDGEMFRRYRFVPGLKSDDPGDLVLAYLETPSKWTWHGERAPFSADERWIVVPVDFRFSGKRNVEGEGEMSERLTKAQFVERLEKTLTHLKDQRRPNWRVVADEHGEFLDDISAADLSCVSR